MLFNSYEFLCLFIPVVWLGYVFLGKLHFRRGALELLWLVAASLVFYGFWNPTYLTLIIGSCCFNYAVSKWLIPRGERFGLSWLIVGVICNLLLLGYFKYTNFAVDNLNDILGLDIRIASIVLPLAISFFTFQQIAFIVDVYRGEAEASTFLRHALFVTFFPQLIAGPIVQHREVIPQFQLPFSERFSSDKLASGIALFSIGLFKKVMIADTLGPLADRVFGVAQSSGNLTALEAWIGTLAFTFQLYFDFSGYATMAVGLGLLFGVRLPENFDSPYRATNIIDFWRRWHITLSRFLRDYLYIPLGGNRIGTSRRYFNILITMVLGGLWHGAAWTFVLWGTLHGVLILGNHALRRFVDQRQFNQRRLKGPIRAAWLFVSWLATFTFVALCWVLFRAETFDGAMNMYAAMLGRHGWTGGELIEALPEIASAQQSTRHMLCLIKDNYLPYIWLAVLPVICVVMPSATRLTKRYHLTIRLGIVTSIALLLSVLKTVFAGETSAFLYFDF